jgi:hypothetical protein
MTTKYPILATVIFTGGGTAPRVGTLKRLIVPTRAHDLKAVLETTFTDRTGATHASVATVFYRDITGLATRQKERVRP